jgi:hypothetical protein
MRDILGFFWASLAAFIFFGIKIVEILIPYFTIFEILFVIYIFSLTSKSIRNLLLLGTFFLFLFSSLSFLDIMKNRFEMWFDNTDLVQNKIWNFIINNKLEGNEIFITDRVGNAPFYYLFYGGIKPDYFLKSSQKISLEPGFERFTKIGNVSFGSFKFLESPRKSNQVWIGMSGEFVSLSKTNNQIPHVPGGDVLYTTDNVRVEDKLMGDKLLIVKTNLK